MAELSGTGVTDTCKRLVVLEASVFETWWNLDSWRFHLRHSNFAKSWTRGSSYTLWLRLFPSCSSTCFIGI